MAQTTCLLFYAINGTGLGHLTRLLAIAREARELLQALGQKADIRFLTTSEGSELAWDFPVYKIPSKSLVRQTDLDAAEFLAGSKLLVLNLVAQIRPHCLILDTAPQGAFSEASMLRSLTRTMIFVDRHKDPKIARSPLHQSHLPLYDQILVPDDADQIERYPVPWELEERRRFVGCVSGLQPEHCLGPDATRDYFQVGYGQRLVYVSAGGGGDAASRAGLHHLVEALAAEPRNHLLVGYGPLHRGQQLYLRNVTPLNLPDASRFFPGLDAAVSAAGYNSYQELLDARVPSVFYAQPKGMDRQDERIAAGLARDWHLEMPGDLVALEPDFIRARLEELLSGSARQRILHHLDQRPAARGALQAAAEILCLRSTLANCPYRRARLLEVSQIRRGWNRRDPFQKSLRWLGHWRKSALNIPTQEDECEKTGADWRQASTEAPQLHWGARLQQFQSRHRISEDVFKKVLNSWCYPGPGDRTAEGSLRRLLERLLDHLDNLAEGEAARLLEEALAQGAQAEFRAGLQKSLDEGDGTEE